MIYFAQKITDLISQTDLPLDFISISGSEGLDDFLDFIYYTDPAFSVSTNGAYFGITIIFTIRLSINFGGDSGFEIAISSDSEESSFFQLNLNVFIGSNGRLSILLSDLGFQFLISREILKPFPERDGRSMIFVNGNLKLDENLNLIIEGYDSINLSESQIGNTGIIISAENIKFDFSRDSAIPEVLEIGLDESFIGVYIGQAVVRYQKEGDQINYRFVVSRSAIGDSGFTGEIGLGSLEFATESADIPVADVLNSLFNDDGEALEVDEADNETLTLYPVNLLGMKMVLQYFGITFRQSIPTTSQILGFVFMPFADRWVRLRASIGGPNGDFMLEVGGTGDAGLIDLDTDVFQIIVNSIAYQNREGINYAIISGSIRLKLPEGLNMPAFRADKISISERGDIEIEGGWVRAPEQINVDLGGFKIGIREIGIGNEGEETPTTRRQ